MFKDNSYIQSMIPNYWIFVYYFLSPFRIFVKKDEKDGGDLYEERCTIGSKTKEKKND